MIQLAFALMLSRLQAGVPALDDAQPDMDEELVRRCVAGDRAAFDELYLRHVNVVHGRLVHLVGRIPETEDLVQEVFLQVFRSLPRFRGDSSFRTWLYRIVVNVSLGCLRTKRRRPIVPLAPEDLELVAGCDHATSPERHAQKWQECQRALGHLAKLKPKHRIAFVLRHVEQLTLEEIGAIVGANAPAVGQRVRKAERELIERLARDERNAARRRQELYAAE